MSKLVYKEEIEKLQKFKRNLSRFRANYDKIKEQYKGEHVAIQDEQIVDSDIDYHNLLQKIRNKHYRNAGSFLIEYVKDREFGYVL